MDEKQYIDARVYTNLSIFLSFPFELNNKRKFNRIEQILGINNELYKINSRLNRM